MNWHLCNDGTKPNDNQDCIAIESRGRNLVPCYWDEHESVFRTYDGESILYLGEVEDYDNYIVAWTTADEIFKDYFANKERLNKGE